MTGALSRFMARTAPFIALLGGIFLIVVGSLRLKHQKEYLPVKAVISSVEFTPGTGDEADTYDAWADYTVDGKRYHSYIGDIGSGHQEGEETDILYDPDDPEKTDIPGTTVPVISICAGGLMILTGGFFTVRMIVSGR